MKKRMIGAILHAEAAQTYVIAEQINADNKF